MYPLQEFYLQLCKSKRSVIKTSMYRSPFKTLQIKTGVEWNAQPLSHCVQWVLFIFNILYFILALQITYQGQAEHGTTFQKSYQLNPRINTSKILLTGQGVYLQVYIPSWWSNILRFTVLRLLESAIVKLSCLWHNLDINPPCRTGPQHIFQKWFVP